MHAVGVVAHPALELQFARQPEHEGTKSDALDLAAHRVHATVFAADGPSRYRREGEGRAVLGDPRLALTWMVNELSARGIALHAGQTVSTGTCMVPLEVVPGDRVEADYGALGRVAVTLLD